MKAKRGLDGLGKNNDTRQEIIQRLTPSVGWNDRKIQLKGRSYILPNFSKAT